MLNKKPIGIVTALHAEASPLIDYFNLKKDIAFKKFEIFSNNRISVIVSGIGKIKSAVATTYFLGQVDPVCVINFGICGTPKPDYKIGDLVVVNKITDVSGRREFFPDMIVKHHLREAHVTTFDTPVTMDMAVELNLDLVDMEASGFFQSASVFLPPDKIAVLKIVSDYLELEHVTREFVTELVQTKLSEIDNFIQHFSTVQFKNGGVFTEEENFLLGELSGRLRLTTAQNHLLREWATAYKITSKKEIAFLNEFLHAKIQNKNERLLVFKRVRAKLGVA